MSLYAFDQKKQLVPACQAYKGQNYLCPECLSIVHCRRGLYRQDHFYHISPVQTCRQNGKSEEHWEVQRYFSKSLPGCLLENFFAEIGRIADVYWPQEKIVFEVQCSSISGQEIAARNHDYAKLGLQVVWVLHEKNFNKSLLTSAELFLRNTCHYFTNIDSQGKGLIYDFFYVAHQSRRLHVLAKLPIDVTHPKRYEGAPLPLKVLEKRFSNSGLYFSGDLYDLYLQNKAVTYCERALSFERQYGAWQSAYFLTAKSLKNHLIAPFRAVFQMMLERFCR